MSEAELITKWINQPQLIKENDLSDLQDLSEKFPYFFPFHYFKAICNFEYKEAPVNRLTELFPVNRVLLFQLFSVKQNEGTNYKIPHLLPDEELEKMITTSNYFLGQGIEVNSTLPVKETPLGKLSLEKDLMVVMSFSEWLSYLESRTQKLREEEADKSALRAMWQKQKLSAALEDEEEEIPDNVFELAINSITAKEEVVSESMAAVYALQGKKEKALEMYKKLSLQNPEKSAYFAKKVDDIQKEVDI